MINWYSSHVSATKPLHHILIALIAVWVAVRVWTPVSVTAKFEVLILLLAIVDIFKTDKSQFKKWPFLFVYISFAIPFLTYISVYLDSPELAEKYSSFEIIPRLTFFVLVAWVLRYVKAPSLFLLTFFSFSLLLALATYENLWPEIQRALEGTRVNLGFRNWQWTSLYFGILAIGACIYLPMFIQKRKFALSAFWGLMLALALFALAVSQTRAVWLALAAVMFLAPLFFLHSKNELFTRKSLIAFAVVTLIVVSIGLLNKELFVKRIAQEFVAVEALFTNPESIPNNSIGVRFKTWSVAYEWIEQRPLFGWGGLIRKGIMTESENLTVRIGHLHSTYFEFLAAFGVVGISFLLALFLYPTFKGLTRATLNEPLNMLTLLVVSYYLIVGLFESYFFFNEGVYLLTLALAARTSQVFFNQDTKEIAG